MRDVIVMAIVLGAAPVCLFSPYFGILMWTWIAYFNPHRFAYGTAYHFPVAITIAVPTVIGTFFTRQRNRKIFTIDFLIFLAMWGWFCYTTYATAHNPLFAGHADTAFDQLILVSKIMAMTVLSVLLITSRDRLKTLLTVAALCFGVLAIKGAIFGARTGGMFRFYGPPESFLEDNNMLALAMNMMLPVMFYLARNETRKILRRLLWISFFCGIGGVLISYSRGGVLAIITSLGMIAIQTRKKILGLSLMLSLTFLVILFAPDAWMDRMSSFFHGNLDESAELRLNAWRFAWTLASAYPLTGGGFETFDPELYARFTPSLKFAGPHSNYFQLLGEQGFVGLGLFLLLVGSLWVTTTKLRRRAGEHPQLAWARDYTYMIQAGLAAYLVGGAFLARAYFDLFYLFVAATVILKILCRQEVARQSEQPESEEVAGEAAELEELSVT
jgi:putative inorganic carbon (HCO3(-)) transporter